MSTQINVQPETAEKLVALAKAKGLSVDELLRDLLGEWEPLQAAMTEPSLEEFERDMNMLGDGLEHLALEYQGTYPRADIYLNHD